MNILSLIFGKPIPTIQVTEVQEKLKQGNQFVLVDVRQPEEYQAGHIAGAKLIPLGELPRRLKDLPKNKEIALVCATGNRSGTAAKMMLEAGLNAFNVPGGMLAWRRASLPVKKGNQP